MSYLPAPYESAQQDDLPAALGAGLTVTLAGITSWILGHQVYRDIRSLVDLASSHLPLPKNVVVPTAGWAIAVLLMVSGGLFLSFRKGRGALVFGAMVSVATTAIAQFTWHWGTASGPEPISQLALFWTGVVVFLVAVLPATGRWVSTAAPAVPAFPTSANLRPHR